MIQSCVSHYYFILDAVSYNKFVYICRELEEYKEKQDDNQNGGDAAKIASKHVSFYTFWTYFVVMHLSNKYNNYIF